MAILLAAALCTAYLLLPHAQDFVEEARSSRAATEARVLQRGAQLVATQRLIAGDSFDTVAQYLASGDGVKQAVQAAAFPVTAAEITGVSLDEKGLLTDFSCVVEYEQRRYAVAFDIASHSGRVDFLEDIAPKDTP